jgi:hypothetical protein
MTTTSTLLLSLLILIFSLWVVVWLLYSFLSPFIPALRNYGGQRTKQGHSSRGSFGFFGGGFRSFHERWRFRRSVRAMQELDQALSKEDHVQARKLFPQALYLEWIESEPELVGKASSHHLDLLNKLLILSELEGGSVRNLPKLETLLTQQGELFAAAFETRVSRKRFIERQREKGKSAPSWSTREFDTRLKDLQKDFHSLRKAIRTEMNQALEGLPSPSRSKSGDDGTNYH